MSEICIHYDAITGEIHCSGTTRVPLPGQFVSTFDVPNGQQLRPDASKQKIDVVTGLLIDKTPEERAGYSGLPPGFEVKPE